MIWNAMMVPVGTPSEITSKLGTEILEILKLPDVQQGFANQGAVMTPGDAARLASFLKTELAKFAKVVKESGARID